MARARVQPVRRPTPAKAKRRRKRVLAKGGAVASFNVPAKAYAALAILATILALPWLMPFAFGVIGVIVEASAELFGFGLLPLAAVIGVAVWSYSGRPLPASTNAWRMLVGGLLLLLALNGLISIFNPDGHIGDVSLQEVTAGGRIGRVFVGSAASYTALAVFFFAGASLIWPPTLTHTRRSAMWLVRGLFELRLPQRIWALMARALVAFVPKTERPAPTDLVAVMPPAPLVDDLALLGDDEFEAIDARALEAGDDAQAQRRLPKAKSPSGESDPGFAAVHPLNSSWESPPIDILKTAVESTTATRANDNAIRAQLIVDTLHSFGVDAKVVQVNQGPTVTQFGIEPGWETKTRTVTERDASGRIVYDKDGNPRSRLEVVSRTRVRVNQITALANDLALALAAPSIRIEAPVPGKPIIGIEVPNSSPSVVSLRSVIESAPFQKMLGRTKLALTLGKGVSGEPVAADLTKMPHLLIAGATGSGKSVCINSIITCLLMHNTPEELRFVMVDPKRVELSAFASIPHLAFSSIVVDPEEVVGTLQAVIHEMEARYKKFAAVGVRNIEAYNRSPKAGRRIPYWVVIIDELADLMMAAPYQVEKQLCRLAQLARATGIHLIVATQRPSVDVITGLIKANFPTRIAFAVTSQVDSRTIIDGSGAEKLLGRGDMLFMPTDAAKPKRLQGVYVSDEEIEELVDFWTSEKFEGLRPETADHLLEEARASTVEEGEDDRLLKQAKALANEHSRISTSLLQRRLRIGYPRAARLMEQLERDEIVGPSEGGGQSRRVLTADDSEDDPD